MTGIERAKRYLREDLWNVDLERQSWPWRLWHRFVRLVYVTIEGFVEDLCTTRASALTFATLLGLVPILALSFAVLRGLGWHGTRLEGLILGKVTILSPEAINLIVSYIDNINFTGLGVFGGAFLFFTFVSVVTNVEGAFNAIWGHAPSRTFGRRVTDYFGVMVVAPVLLVIAMSMTAAVESNTFVQWMTRVWGVGVAVEYSLAYAATVVVWALFAFLYMFVPNTRVRPVAAIAAGVIAGTTWQLTQWAYIGFQVGMTKYNAIYGALAQLPLLMVWIYVSWVIVLLGAEIAYSIQTLSAYSRERRVSSFAGQSFREWVAMSTAIELARAAEGLTPAPTPEALAACLDVPLRTVRDVLAAFETAGLAHGAGQNPELCYLSLAPARIPVTKVIEAIHGELPPIVDLDSTPGVARKRAHALLLEIRGESELRFGERTLKDLALDGEAPRPRDESGAPLRRAVGGTQRAGFGTGRRDLRKGGA